MSEHSLNLGGVPCPTNFVKVRLFLDKMASGEVVDVVLDDGEPIESVSGSVVAEGHQIERKERLSTGQWCLSIRKT